ncbi:MAG: tetratricopeptide repeat protein [Endomicrobium sp.]|jgi:tetratricopeptide (TPR) repeat protein|nr:tetratricopeptide repeat protein [Endomicrobium sp.]
MSEEEIVYKMNELSLKIDEARKKKDIIALYEEYAEMFFSNKAYRMAVDIYLVLIEMKPSKKKKAEYFVKLGDIEAAQKSYNESIEYYSSALSLYKKNNNIRCKIGDILLQSNLYGLAEQCFKDILDLDKNSDYAKRKLGDIYFWQKKYSTALKYYESVSPSYYDKEIIANFSECYKNLNNYKKAIMLVDDFIEEHADSDLYLLSGLLYAETGNVPKAKEQFFSAVEADPNNFAACVNLAAIYLDNGDMDKAEEMLKKANLINSYTAVVDMMFASIAYKKGRLYEARRYASNAVLKSKRPFLKQQSQRMLDFLTKSDK